MGSYICSTTVCKPANKILCGHDFVAQMIIMRTTLGRTAAMLAMFSCSAGSGEEKVELAVEC